MLVEWRYFSFNDNKKWPNDKEKSITHLWTVIEGKEREIKPIVPDQNNGTSQEMGSQISISTMTMIYFNGQVQAEPKNITSNHL